MFATVRPGALNGGSGLLKLDVRGGSLRFGQRFGEGSPRFGEARQGLVRFGKVR